MALCFEGVGIKLQGSVDSYLVGVLEWRRSTTGCILTLGSTMMS